MERNAASGKIEGASKQKSAPGVSQKRRRRRGSGGKNSYVLRHPQCHSSLFSSQFRSLYVLLEMNAC